MYPASLSSELVPLRHCREIDHVKISLPDVDLCKPRQLGESNISGMPRSLQAIYVGFGDMSMSS